MLRILSFFMAKANSSHLLLSSFYSHIIFCFLLYAAYFTFCLIYSSCYLDFIKRRKWSEKIAISIIVMGLILATVLCYIGLIIYPLNRVTNLALSYVVILVFIVTTRTLSFIKIRVLPEEIELDGLKFHTYIGPEVNAFYNSRTRKINVHKELLEVLTPHELRAILQHEIGHQYQFLRKSFLVIQFLTSLALSLWFLGGLVLVMIAGHALSIVIFNVLFGGYLTEMLENLFLFVTLHPILSSILLALTSAFWIWEYDADLYATEKIGTDVFMKALVKVYLVRKLGEGVKFVKLEGCSISVSLDHIPHLTLFSIAKELLIQTLPLCGSIDELFKPLEKTHPPLHLRLRALQTASSETVSHKQPDLS